MFTKSSLCILLSLLFASATIAVSQQTSSVSPSANPVPHVVRYAGTADATPGQILTMKFSLYENQAGGDPVWSESQQVTPDAAGKYSVLLGAATESGLPQNVFSAAQARWLGITVGDGQESARTLLVATPYSLKASDAETLGGHPVSDFTLKSALPAGGTNITQIDGSNGVVVNGSGTGPTVTLGLSNSYLQTLGNDVFAQLSGNNLLTGTNAFSAGKVTIGGSPALTAANISASSPVTATISGAAVKIGLSSSALETLGNGLYAQLAAANTFAKAQTFQSAVTFASGQTFPGTVSLSANNAFTGSDSFSKPITFAAGQTFPGTGTGTITGITTSAPLSGSGTSGSVALSLNTSALETTLGSIYPGLGANNTFTGNNTFHGSVQATAATTGVYGHDTDTNQSDATVGVYGLVDNTNSSSAGVYGAASAGGNAAGVHGVSVGSSSSGTSVIQANGMSPGVWGDAADSKTSNPVGVLASADDGYGAYVVNNSPGNYYTFLVVNENTVNSGNETLVVYNAGSGTECTIDDKANLSCSGHYSSINSVENRKLSTFGVESAENWIEDAGGGQLSGGHAQVTLDPAFVGTVNTGVEYRVFLTPKGESENLYVVNESPSGFEVREAHGGRSNIAFDYRIMAKRKGSESARLTDVTAKIAKSRVALAHKPNAAASLSGPSLK